MKSNIETRPLKRPAGEIRIFSNLEELSSAAASFFVDVANGAVRGSGACRVALSGGSTPKTMYSILARPEFLTRIPWNHVHFFWGDERCVPPDDPESNYGMVRHVLLQRIPIPPGNVHRIRGEIDPEQAAGEYESVLRQCFRAGLHELPRFDLMLLGLGENGHTASLFPGAPALRETHRLSTTVYVEELKSHRITLTFPIINHSAVVAFLIAGVGKSSIVARVLKDDSGEHGKLPAQRVKPTDGKLIWFLDKGAAEEVSRS